MAINVFERWARRISRRRSVIFCYHGVGKTAAQLDPGFLRVHPDAFRAQLELLLEAGFEFVTVAEFARRWDGKRPLPGLAALTFDDGMVDNHTDVRPILREYGVTATFYVTSGLIGQPNPWLPDDADARMMTVGELRDLVDAGFEIGAHSVTHPDLSVLDYEACFQEVNESRVQLETLLGISVTTFAYPFCEYGPAAIAAVRDAGYLAAVTCGSGVGSWNRFELPRSIISRMDGSLTFVLKLADYHHPIFLSPPGRFVRAATRSYRHRRRARRESQRYSEAD